MKRQASFLFATPLLIPAISVQSQQPMKPATPEQILERMAEVYARCKTYRDSGSVTTVFFEADRNWTECMPFTTAFVRPNRFRFEYQEVEDGEVERYLIWRDGARVRTWWDVTPGIEENVSLARAIAGATGVSSGSAQAVPGYLMPAEVKAWRMSGLRDLRRIDDASIGDLSCFRITGTLEPERCTSVLLWIDMRAALLRRIDEQTTFDTFRTEETTLYDPVIDEPIPESLLVFDPPQREDH